MKNFSVFDLIDLSLFFAVFILEILTYLQDL